MIKLEKKIFAQIICHAQKDFPDEACGILAGKNGRVLAAYKMVNLDKGPESFLMEPKEQFKVIKDIRKRGLEMAAIYHSHPKSPAYPSARDVELAFYPDVSYIIVSLYDKNNPVLRSFKIRNGKISEEEVR